MMKTLSGFTDSLPVTTHANLRKSSVCAGMCLSTKQAPGTTPTAVTVSQDGAFLYVANQGSNDVFAYAISSASGGLTAVSGTPFPAGVAPRAIATPGRP